MTRYLLDSDILRGIKDKDEHVFKWLESVDDEEIWISVIALYESAKGVVRAIKKAGGDPLTAPAWKQVDVLRDAFKDRIAELDPGAATDWGPLGRYSGEARLR